jgi:phosphoribosylamine--glycine ligase
MAKEKILVLGSGGREHALVWHLLRFGHRVECSPGNDGISEIAPTWPFEDYEDLLAKIKSQSFDLVLIGPETYLADGLVDLLEKNGIFTWGPNQCAAQLETDKSYSKDFCLEMGVPTAKASVVQEMKDFDSALDQFSNPYVIKASGLAAGKGVWIGNDKNEARSFADKALSGHPSVLIEEFLSGRELSCFYLIHNDRFSFLGAACDYKRLLDHDLGPNTGGMGAYSPPTFWSSGLQKRIEEQILLPTLNGFAKRNMAYRGFLFLGLMLAPDDRVYLIEYNCRLGDPETQAILPRLTSSLASRLFELREKNPSPHSNFLAPQVSLAVVGSSKEYPSPTKSPVELSELLSLPKQHLLFHAGTKKEGSIFWGTGGRLFCISLLDNTLESCRHQIYSWLQEKTLDSKIHFRKDIGLIEGDCHDETARI